MNFLSDSYDYYMFTQTLNLSAKGKIFLLRLRWILASSNRGLPPVVDVLITTNMTKKNRQRYHSDSFDEYHTLHV